jgi:adenylate cyclase
MSAYPGVRQTQLTDRIRPNLRKRWHGLAGPRTSAPLRLSMICRRNTSTVRRSRAQSAKEDIMTSVRVAIDQVPWLPASEMFGEAAVYQGKPIIEAKTLTDRRSEGGGISYLLRFCPPEGKLIKVVAVARSDEHVVLPFTNLADDREQQYFADGITEDLTTDLSRIAGMLVISRNTAFTYQGKRVDTKQIGRELCVRYVLEGSVRRSGNQIRVNAQLIDAETDAHLWAERFDGDMRDLFALQDEITRHIAVALNLELVRAEAARPTQHPDALDYIFRGRAALFGGPPSRERYAEVIALYEHALTLDPRSADAQSWLAIVLASRALDVMTDTATADLERAESLARQALTALSRSSFAHYARGEVLRVKRRYGEALPEYEAARSANPNYVHALHALALCKIYTGSIEEAIPLEEQAIRLSPRDAFIGNWYAAISFAHLLQSRTNEAIIWAQKARNANPAHPIFRVRLASAFALAGETQRAAPNSPRPAG